MYHYYSLVMTSKGEWVVGDTLDTDGLNNEDYKSKYQRLQAGRRIWKKETQALTRNLLDIKAEKEKPRKGDTADTEQTIQALRRTLQEKENEKVRDAQRFRQQLEQKEERERGRDTAISSPVTREGERRSRERARNTKILSSITRECKRATREGERNTSKE